KIFSDETLSTLAFTFKVTVNAADGSFSIDTSALPDGTYYWQMVATDAAGNLSDAVKGAAPLVVDTAITDFSAGLDAGSDSGESSDDAITNKNVAQLSGKGEPGATISLNSLINTTTGVSVAVGSLTATVDDNGRWQLQLPSLPNDGVYSWSVTITDIAGNSQTLTGSFTLDTNIDFTGGFDASSDSGESSSDLLTNVAEPKFSGTGTDGDTITVLLTGPNGYSQTLTTTVQNGAWEINFANLAKLVADGNYSWVATATDVAGNSKELSGDFSFDSTPLDIEAKLLSDSGFDNADHITNSDTLKFQVNVNDKASSVRLVLWPANGSQSTPTFEQSLSFTGSNQYSFSIPWLAEGEYKYCVIATDVAGNVSEMAPVSIIVDRTAPELGDITQADLQGDQYVNDAALSFSGTGEPGSKIYFTLQRSDGTEINVSPAYVTVEADGSWTYQLDGTAALQLSDGTYNWSFIAEDVAGNRSAAKNGDFTLDTIDPVLEFTGIDASTDSGASSSDLITNNERPIFTGTISEPGTITVTLTSVSSGATFTQSVTVGASGAWSLTWGQAIAEGEYKVTLSATDLAGNLSTPLESKNNLKVDKSVVGGDDVGLAQESDTGADPSDNITNQQNIKISGNVESGTTVRLQSLSGPDGTSYNTSQLPTITSDSKGNWALTLPTLSSGDGVYEYTIEYTDIAGNQKTVSSSFTLDTQGVIVTGELDAASNSGDTSDAITNNKLPTFTGTVSEEAKLTFKILQGDTVIQSSDPFTVSGNWSFTLTEPLPDGVYTWQAEVSDTAGNTTIISGALTIDTTGPTILNMGLAEDSDSGVSSDDGITNQKNLTFTGSLAGEGAHNVTLRFEFGVKGGALTAQELVVNGDGEFNFNVSADVDGLYEWKIVATDIAGNVSEKTGVVHVDTVLEAFSPESGFDNVLADGSPGTGNNTNNKTPSFSGHTEPNAKVVLTIQFAGALVASVEVFADKDGNFSITVPSEQALAVDGEYSWTLNASDIAGNSQSISGQIILDATPPDIRFDLADDTGADSDDWITSNKQISINGTSNENANVIVTILQGSSIIDSQTLSPNPDWNYSAGLEDGSYTVKIESVDAAGNKFTSQKTLVIDTQISNEFSLTNDTGLVGDQITNAAFLNFSGKTDKDASVTLVVKDSNGALLHSYNVTVNSNTGAWSFQVPASLPDGNYTISVTATDLAGNSNTIDGYNVTIDRTAPTISGIVLDAEDDTGTVGDWVTSTQDGLTIRGSVTMPGSTMTVTISGTDITIEPEIASDGSFVVELPNLEFGTYTLIFTATDIAGNVTTVEQNLQVTNNYIPFEIDMDDASNSGAKDDWVTNIKDITFVGRGTPGYTVELRNGSFNAPDNTIRTTIDADGNWTLTVPPGSYDERNEVDTDKRYYSTWWTVKDIAGNIVERDFKRVYIDVSVSTTVDLDEVSDSGTAGDFITNARSVVIKGTTEVGNTMTIRNVDTKEVLGGLTTTSETWSFTLSNLPEGVNHFTIEMLDLAGNTATKNFSITIDRTAPTVSATLDGEELGSSFVDNEFNQSFSGKVEGDATSLVVLVNGVSHEITLNDDGTWAIDLVLGEGLNKIEFIVSDVAGNQSSVVSEITIKSTIRFTMTLENDDGRFENDKILSGDKLQLSGSG
ncbi:MAG: Ig-like domain-containing protein, partial [Plesiomonas shigelloides]